MTPTPMNPPNPNEAERLKARNLLGGVYLEESGNSDNLAIALASYFEGHCDRPSPDPIDDEIGLGEWVIKKTNEALDRIVAETRPAPLPPTGEGAKEEAGVLIMTPLTGTWRTRCCVCRKEYENGVGSTECCGSIQEIIKPDLTHPALRAAEEALGAARGFIAGVSFCNDEGERKEILDATTAALELIRAARKGGEGV